ncbi:MAG: helix-turn-helix domain-containing protein [Muribaculaceae bacterium]
MKTRLIIICICLVAAIYGMQSVTHHQAYTQWSTMQPEQLMAKGERFLDGGRVDSAMICFSLITQDAAIRDKAGSEQVARAYLLRWQILFYHFYDYGKAIESLHHAEACNNISARLTAQIAMNYGITYHTMGVQCNDSTFLSRAFDKYNIALRYANADIADLIISNSLELAFVNGMWMQVDSIWSGYQQLYSHREPSWRYSYNVLMHNGMDAMVRGDGTLAANYFQQQIAAMDYDSDRLRYRLMAHINCAKALDMCGRFAEAIDNISQSEALADSVQAKDAQLEIYDLKRRIYDHWGKAAEANQYNIKYLQLKSNILSYKQLHNITEQDFLNQLQEISDDLHQEREKRHRMITIACICVTFTLAILILLLLLYKKNRSLHEKNLRLYRNIEEMTAKPTEKYRQSNLDDEDKELLRAKIEDTMAHSSEIFSSDFSAQQLAEAIGEHYKKVSQIINECYGCNFNAFINKYRVQEACRRMADRQTYGNLTIEGLGQSVGFKSRSTFINAFKANTGLTPSEYIKLASDQ